MTLAKISLIGLVLLVFSVLYAFADEKFSCSDGRWLSTYTSDGENRASWGTVFQSDGKKVRVSCGFWDGHEFMLKKLNWWIDGEPLNRGVWVYRGLANTCSQGSLLIFNERASSVLIVNVSDFSSIKYECTRPPELQ